MKRLLVLFVIAGAAVAFAPTAVTADEARSKAKTVLKKVVKAFSKEKNYQVELQVAGGFSNSKDHSIQRQTVSQRYSGEYYKGVMRLPEPRIIRTRAKGAIRQAGNWYQILAHPDGTMVQRLFHFPDEVLKDAIRSGADVQWVEGETETVVDGDGRTGVAKKITVTPDKLIVELPTKVALQRYNMIQTSGATSDC